MLTMISEFVLSAGSIGPEIAERLGISAVGERVRGSARCEGGGPWRPGANSTEARGLALEASPLHQPLAELTRKGFTETVAELRARLDSMVSDTMRRSVRWPNGLNSALRRMAATLRAVGFEPRFSRNNGQGRRMVSVMPYAAQVRKDRQ
jgi:hypothetical protein